MGNHDFAVCGCEPDFQESLIKLDDPDEALATLAKALAHPIRVRILRILAQKQTCIHGDLADVFHLAPSTISQHLKVLKESGIVQATPDGARMCYCIHPNTLRQLRVLVADL
jgi:DNA-binding transcriptional ArsR family regulator